MKIADLGLHASLATLAQALADACAKESIVLGFSQGFRSFPQQQAIWDRGRTTPGEPCWHGNVRYGIGTCPNGQHPLGASVTDAKPGYSWHNWRGNRVGAFEIDIESYPEDRTPSDLYDGPFDRVGMIGESLGLEWGGRWKRADRPHFELREGVTLAGLLLRFPMGTEEDVA